jgi:glycosyltransferase involved in cell wall biosynthesis
MGQDPSPSRISIIMPVFNGRDTLDRAVDSVIRQGLFAWELIVVDDGSTDESYARLLRWANRDRGIRVLRNEENRGPAAARNAALWHATGDLVAYLDGDDEYYPDYLEQVDRFGARADVLVFGYDLVHDDAGPGSPRMTWDPGRRRDRLFVENIMTPLGVAHRRDLWAAVGGFDESLRFEEDWDFWKRLARAGASFAYLPLKSGLYHIREGSLSRSREGPDARPTTPSTSSPYTTIDSTSPGHA